MNASFSKTATCLSGLLLLLFTLGPVCAARADGFIIIDPPGPVPPRPSRIAPPPITPLAVERHHVVTEIDGRVATTKINQEFHNPGRGQVEGTYFFPVPADAQISHFHMVADGKRMEAELLPADKAREIYEEIVRKAKDPALLEYAGRDLYKVRVFPIPPGGSREIQIEYQELLRADAGTLSYRYPLSTEKFSSQPVKSLSIKAVIRQPAPVSTVYSPSHEVRINRDPADPGRLSVEWEAKDQRPDTDFDLIFSTSEAPVGATLLAHREGEEPGFFLLLLSPGQSSAAPPQPKDVAFVIDTSGSMAGTKIAQARKALAYCIDNLNAEDRFEVIRFSTEVEPLFKSLADASPENRREAVKFVEGLKPRGGTAIAAALKASIETFTDPARPRLVIFLTDGLPTVGETVDDKIVALLSKEDAAPPRIFAFGVGSDVNSHLLDRIAESTRAFAQYVTPKEDLEQKLAAFSDRISEPVLTDLSIDTGAVRLSELHPAALPDLFAGDQLVIAGRYQNPGTVTLVLKGKRLGRTEEHRFQVVFPAAESSNTFIPRLWAGRRIGYLLDEIRLRGESKELAGEIAELARAHGIITPYTAWLILEDEARRDVPPAQRSLQSLDRDAAGRGAARFGYERLREESKGAKDGEAAFENARAQNAMKFAERPLATAAPAQTAAFSAIESYAASGGGSGGAPARAAITSGLAQVREMTNATKQVQRKTFVQNGSRWIDTSAQMVKNQAPRRIRFNSAEYFDLMKKHPGSAAYLALGDEILLLLDGILYEILPEESAS